MIRLRKSHERGHADYGWLNTYHTFSFAGYQDPDHMQFRDLRVINEDRVQPGKGFGTHGHRDMEIISYVLEGQLEHKDSLGTGSVIQKGELQRITAGTGVRHSEFNLSETEVVHFYQIWLLPDREGIDPSYERRKYHKEEKLNQFRLVASPDGRQESLKIHQNAELYLAVVESGRELAYPLQEDKFAWVQVLRGAVELNGHQLSAGDGAAISDERMINLRGSNPEAEVLLFDLN